MFTSLKCPNCETGNLYYDARESYKSFSFPESFTLNEIEGFVDGIVNGYLVYTCPDCGVGIRQTYKEIEKSIREELSQKVMTMMAKGEILGAMVSPEFNRVLVHCGKCNGSDGNGSCLIEVYKKCELKRLPNGL